MLPVKRRSHDLTYKGEREVGGVKVLQGVGDLPCRRIVTEFGPKIVSHWKPSPEELETLIAGGVVELGLFGEPIPPISLGVAGYEEPIDEG